MIELKIGPQLVRVDPEATAAYYRSAETQAGADECTCAACKNFAQQRAVAYPGEFVAWVRQLGVDPAKELEAFDYDFVDADGMHTYGGWFVLCGEVVEGAAWRPSEELAAFAYWFTDSFPTGGLPSGQKFCAIEFSTRLPWVLESRKS